MFHLPSNIPSTNGLLRIVSWLLLELLSIARCTTILYDFVTRASELFIRIIAQSGNCATLTKQLRKGISGIYLL